MRTDAGRNAGLSYAIIDSQSVKTTSAAEERGIDRRKNKWMQTAHRSGYYGEWEDHLCGDLLASVLDRAAADAGAEAVVAEADGLEVVCRKAGGHTIYFVMNFGDQERQIPEKFSGYTDLLSEKAVSPDVMVKKYDVAIIVKKDMH